MIASAGAVMLYAIATLVAAARAPHVGMFTLQGSPVWSVEDGSPAHRAGVRRGDAIVAIGGRPVQGAAQNQALRALAPGEPVAITVERIASAGARPGAEPERRRLDLALVPERKPPLGSAAGILLAALLLTLALAADRGAASSLPRLFFRNTLVYIVFLAGAFSHDTAARDPVLAVPWYFAFALAAPVTCHHMLRFPAGAAWLTRAQLCAIYAPPLVLAAVFAANHAAFLLGLGFEPVIGRVGGGIAGAMAAAYLTVGAVARARRLRRKRDEIDPVARRWLHLGGAFQAVPLVVAAAWATRDVGAFVAGGFRPFVAVTMIGGSACLTLAMTRTPFGELDRMWRRSSGYFLATLVAAGLYLALIALLGGTASTLSGGSVEVALAATLLAAVVFGPLRRKLQQMADERFARDRSRARRLLREAAEAAAATLDIGALQRGIVDRVNRALRGDGAALYVREADGGWRREVITGELALGTRFGPGSPVCRLLDGALADRPRAPRALPGGAVGVPLAAKNAPAALVVAPAEGTRFHDEDLELLMTAAAQLVVAVDNARAHAALLAVTEELRREVERAERRRREIARLKERVEAENRALIATLAARSGAAPLIGDGLAPTFALAQKVARSDAGVLVRGETGVGKELFARAIHAASSRRDGPFVVVDCGAIAAGVFESALFGHVKGAFTGAVKDAEGAFRAAHGGTIFLDEIGELPLSLQPALLRALQEREVQPVGSSAPIPVDVRVIAGTNRDLAAEAAGGAFRPDLLYRLQVVEIVVPPLRRRRGDIPDLARHFLEQHARRRRRAAKRLSPEALDALMEHDWPGNVRELEHAMEAASVFADGDDIRPGDLPIFDEVFRKKGRRAITGGEAPCCADGAPKSGLRETLEDLERQRLIDALAEHDGNKSRTARALGMSRGALLRRIRRYQLSA